MDVNSRLKNSLIRKIQRLSTDKLTEISNLLGKIEHQMKSKERTLSFAGSWKDLDSDLLLDFTTNLHDNRTNDRQID
jgi:hypothetical protein